MLDPKMSYLGERVDGDPIDERQHVYPCKACGQDVDKRDLGAVMHHEESGHQPLPEAEAKRVLRVSGMLRFTLGERP
ncbi:MAG TPA: hypothetical protein VM471_04440 [Phenylobacterium sp.]|nr:hypothetical protein [Phenylobacterium sp.]